MTQQPEAEKLERAPAEGKYRYLADLNRQDSPNLRKLYRNSFEGSDKRSSSSHRHSPFSSHKRSTLINRYSPSCSTFNPRREITQEEFSPYDDRHDKEEERLNQELRDENLQLKTQLIQATQTMESLKFELSRREGELIQVREASQADLHYFEKVVSEMTGEIQLVLTKNKILQNELVVVKSRLQEELRRQEDISRIQDDRRKYQQRRRDEISREQRKSVGVLTSQPQSRRSVGKLLTRPTTTQDKTLLGTSKIKIEEDSQNLSNQANCEGKPSQNSVQHPDKLEKEAKKGEQLIESIRSMYFKIKGSQSSSLRQLWKWLKNLGHSHSCLKRWKARAQTSNYLNSDRLRELLKEGCSYIQ